MGIERPRGREGADQLEPHPQSWVGCGVVEADAVIADRDRDLGAVALDSQIDVAGRLRVGVTDCVSDRLADDKGDRR